MKMKVDATLKAESNNRVKVFNLTDEIEGSTRADIIETAKAMIYTKATKYYNNSIQYAEFKVNYSYAV